MRPGRARSPISSHQHISHQASSEMIGFTEAALAAYFTRSGPVRRHPRGEGEGREEAEATWYTLAKMNAADVSAGCPFCRGHHPLDVLVCPLTGERLKLEGRRLDGKFRLIRRLGEGGMGEVWEAEQIEIRKIVAVKLMLAYLGASAESLARFRSEATAAGRIDSVYVCDVTGFGTSALGPYIVLEKLKGRAFDKHIASRGKIAPDQVVQFTCEALKGLGAAHLAGIVHRDLKPENIFLHEPEPGRTLVKLMDFGISKFPHSENKGVLTLAGTKMGTPQYMSPEQFEDSGKVDYRTDIWAIGVIMYKALTGIDPFPGDTFYAVQSAVTHRVHTPIPKLVDNVPLELAKVVDKCLAKVPSERYQSCDDLRKALSPFEHPHLPGLKQPSPGPRRIRAFLMGGGIGVILILMVAAVQGWRRSQNVTPLNLSPSTAAPNSSITTVVTASPTPQTSLPTGGRKEPSVIPVSKKNPLPPPADTGGLDPQPQPVLPSETTDKPKGRLRKSGKKDPVPPPVAEQEAAPADAPEGAPAADAPKAEPPLPPSQPTVSPREACNELRKQLQPLVDACRRLHPEVISDELKYKSTIRVSSGKVSSTTDAETMAGRRECTNKETQSLKLKVPFEGTFTFDYATFVTASNTGCAGL